LSIRIALAEQRLDLLQGGAAFKSYVISTSKNGAGERAGSYQTPRGAHLIRAKIGDGAPLGTVFRGRRPTGEIYSEELARAQPGRDWILTRVLWLSGLEVGRNRLGAVDTMRRYIYIHGTPDSTRLGGTSARSVVRMRNWASSSCSISCRKAPASRSRNIRGQISREELKCRSAL
jgi:hypothetical protein